LGIRIGNAASPRWYDQSLARLDEYIDALVDWGATSTELVLHRGEADEQTARVHVLEEDWFPVFERFLARGIVSHAHAPLHPRFKLDRWRSDPLGLGADFLPVLDAVARFAERQGAPSVLVVHGASGDAPAAAETSASFLSWAAKELEQRSAGASLAVELRRPRVSGDAAFDRSRTALEVFLRRLCEDRVGACWDIGHDWEGRKLNPVWNEQPEDEFLALVSHVHLHDAGDHDEAVHYPLKANRIPWRSLLRPLTGRGFDGAITLEVRYRFARAMGDPWTMLGDSYARFSSFLRSDPFEELTEEQAKASA
jgi:sugar phosphate isomerase/epimerase